MKSFRVAVIGLGNMGQHHVRNYFELPEANLVAVCDPNKEKSNQFAQKYRCNSYQSVEDLLKNENIDAVTIAAPTSYHYEIAKITLNKKIHTLVEKPIADTLDRAQALNELSKKNNVILMVGHIERFNAAISKLKEIIQEGVLGKIISLISRRVGVFPPQIKDANVLIDLAVHDIDIFNYIYEKLPDHSVINSGKALLEDREDYANIFLNYGDQNGFIQVNWITPVKIRSLAITGTKAYAELNYTTQELSIYETNVSSSIDKSGILIPTFDFSERKSFSFEKTEPLKKEIQHFLECVHQNKQPIVSGTEGINALKTVLNLSS